MTLIVMVRLVNKLKHDRKLALVAFAALASAVIACNVTLTGELPTPTPIPPTSPVTAVPVIQNPTNAQTPAAQTPVVPAPPTAPPTPIIPTPLPAPSEAPKGPTEVIKATPSYLPATATQAPPTISPVPTVSLSGKVCPSCESLRVREQPNTSAPILVQLPPNTELRVIGRTMDGTWLRVVTPDGRTGWAYAPFIVVTVNLNTVNIYNPAGVDTPTAAPTAPSLALQGAPLPSSVITGITSKSRQIFLLGQQRGNLPGVFTRVGDSLSAHHSFYQQPTVQGLGEYGSLSAAVGFFSSLNGRGSNSFIASSIAARNFWRSGDVLNPANSFPDICSPGETPLACEYRLVRPSVSIILIGTNDAGQGIAPEEFRANLQRIVQISMDMGVIPVLNTLPPKHLDGWNSSRVDEFNGIIVGVARIYDIPLINLYLALQNLPNQGILPDGVHFNSPGDGPQNAVFSGDNLKYGFPMRNLVTLQMLDQLRRQVLYGGNPNNVPPPPAVLAKLPTISNVAPAAAPASNARCDQAPAQRLQVGKSGRVTQGLPNKVRAKPGTDGSQIGAIPAGATFSITGGPQCADSLRWWQINYKGLAGWTADGQGGEIWLEPAP